MAQNFDANFAFRSLWISSICGFFDPQFNHPFNPFKPRQMSDAHILKPLKIMPVVQVWQKRQAMMAWKSWVLKVI
jgi:hypothetical protein